MIRIACLSAAITLGAVVSYGQSAHAQDVQVSASSMLADEAPDLHRMLVGMGMYDIITLMGAENTRGGADLEEQLFPGAGGAAWQAMVARLHATDRMIGMFEAEFNRDALTPEQVAIIQAFMSSDVGQRMVAGEVAAREQFLEDAAVVTANDVFMAAVESADPRLEILQRLNEVNGLVDRNVSGALNLRFAFYRGLIDGGAFDGDVPEDLMLAEVWGQEPEVRHMTIEWLFSYQLAAYANASDADLEAYLALYESDAGRAVNAVLFAAFDEMLADLSYELGAAAAMFIAGEDT